MGIRRSEGKEDSGERQRRDLQELERIPGDSFLNAMAMRFFHEFEWLEWGMFSRFCDRILEGRGLVQFLIPHFEFWSNLPVSRSAVCRDDSLFCSAWNQRRLYDTTNPDRLPEDTGFGGEREDARTAEAELGFDVFAVALDSFAIISPLRVDWIIGKMPMF